MSTAIHGRAAPVPGRPAPPQRPGRPLRGRLRLRRSVPLPFALVVITVVLSGLIITGLLAAHQNSATPALVGAAFDAVAPAGGSRALATLWAITGVLVVTCGALVGVIFYGRRSRRHVRRDADDGSVSPRQTLALLMERHAAVDEAEAWHSVLAAMDAMDSELGEYHSYLGTSDAPAPAESPAVYRILRRQPLGILHLDVADRLLYANAAARRLLSLDGVAYPPVSLADQWPEPALVQTILDLRHSVGAAGLDCALRPDGVGSIVHLAPLDLGPDSDDLVVSVTDITDVKQAERSRDELLTHLTHELRTPLTSIRAYAETLNDNLFEDERTRRECYQVITTETRRLAKLIEDVLTVSQIDAGTARLARVSVRMEELLRQAVQELQPAADAKSLELTLEIPADAPEIPGDRFRLYQVWYNVIGNAVKYTPAGGSVSVKLECDAHVLRVSVADTGIGVAPQWQDRVFEKFFRIEDVAFEEPAGAGLGLAIARDVVHLHGGSIWMESAPGRGTTVTVKLPVTGSTTGLEPLGMTDGLHSDC